MFAPQHLNACCSLSNQIYQFRQPPFMWGEFVYFRFTCDSSAISFSAGPFHCFCNRFFSLLLSLLARVSYLTYLNLWCILSLMYPLSDVSPSYSNSEFSVFNRLADRQELSMSFRYKCNIGICGFISASGKRYRPWTEAKHCSRTSLKYSLHSSVVFNTSALVSKFQAFHSGIFCLIHVILEVFSVIPNRAVKKDTLRKNKTPVLENAIVESWSFFCIATTLHIDFT